MSLIRVERKDALAVLTLMRPPVNALSPEYVSELEKILATLAEDSEIRVLLLASGVKGFFAAGADLVHLQEMRKDAYQLARCYQQVFSRLEALPFPTVAALSGHALGGGLELALACDFRLMVDDGKSLAGLPEARLGLLPGAGGTQRLSRVVGFGQALEMLMLGQRLKAPAALQSGLVHRVWPADTFAAESLQFALKLAQQATFSLGRIKRCLYTGLDLPLVQGLEVEAAAFAETMGSQDMAEGVSAFLDGRSPVFSGR